MLSVQHNLCAVLDLNLLFLRLFLTPPPTPPLLLSDRDLKFSAFIDFTWVFFERFVHLCDSQSCRWCWASMLLDSWNKYVTTDFLCTLLTNSDLRLCSMLPHSIREEGGGGWPVLIIHCFSNLLECVLPFASSILHFLLCRHDLVGYVSTLPLPLQANLCLYSFLSSAFVSFSAATAWKTTQCPPVCNICPVIVKSFILSQTRDPLSISQQGNSEGFVV